MSRRDSCSDDLFWIFMMLVLFALAFAPELRAMWGDLLRAIAGVPPGEVTR